MAGAAARRIRRKKCRTRRSRSADNIKFWDVFQKLVDGDMRSTALLQAFFDVSLHSSRVWPRDTRNLPAVESKCEGSGSAGGSATGAKGRGECERNASAGSVAGYRRRSCAACSLNSICSRRKRSVSALRKRRRASDSPALSVRSSLNLLRFCHAGHTHWWSTACTSVSSAGNGCCTSRR